MKIPIDHQFNVMWSHILYDIIDFKLFIARLFLCW